MSFDGNLKADFIFDGGATCDTVLNVGFRLHGNTSRASRKNHLKLNLMRLSRAKNILESKKSI